jgi:enamine deaminase RidA (YjgF/YER057c/UK114 family)
MEVSMPAGNPSIGPGARLRALDLELPAAPKPLGNYVETSQVGSLLFVSGTLPVSNGKLAISGRLGDELTVEQGREAARLAAMNTLAAVLEYIGDLDRIKKLAKLNIYLATTSQFTDHATVGDGASDLFAHIFGKESGHVRMISGVTSLPKGTPVVVETIFELNGKERYE